MGRTSASLALMFVLAFPLVARTEIDDPGSFVTTVYRSFAASESTGNGYTPPEDLYAPQLAKLIRDERKRANGEAGCIDFVFCVNGQDWALTQITVSTKVLSPTHRAVIARFVNIGDPQQIEFDFRRIAGHWMIADVHSVKEPRWILSRLLQCKH